MKSLHRVVFALALAGTFIVGSQAARAGEDPKRDKEIEEKFKAADKDGDGKLTLAEAKAGMPRIAKGFDKIDKDKKGYITVDQIKAFAASQ
jgi:Ca2+-binding EF-hand superfamily protein